MGGGEMSNAMLNIINQETTKEDHLRNYASYPDTQPEGFTPFNASTVEPMFCEIPVGSKVLDVGCNSGEFMKMLQDGKGCQTVGVDVSKTALRLARKKGLKVKNASAESLPFKDGTFDVAILREVLVHIHEPVKALKEIRRVLKKDGFLLGSAPHANLERKLWDDKHLHHRYYDEHTLQADLDQAFDVTHMKVLNGAQFSISFAMSHLAEKPCELLFKCGGENLPVWEAALMADKDTLRIWMGPTQQPGDVYYRMIGYAAKMRQMPGVEVGFEQFNWTANDSCSEWQRKILANPEAEPISALALHHLEKCLKVANPWVFQITYYEDIIAFFECAKQVHKDKKLVTEVDDWIFDVPSYNIASHPYKPNSEKEQIAYAQLELSDAVIVSTSFLKENLQRMFPEKPMHIIPNSIDFNIWDNVQGDGKMEPKGEGVVRIGYTGCANHSGDMEIVKPVLLALLEEFPKLEVIIAQDLGCFADVSHPRLKILKRWASIIDYPAMVKGWDLDIGIAPLRDNQFNRAKSNLRWLEYSALKIPTVASDVRPFTESIRDKWDGRLCKDKNEWYATLKLLIEQPAARKGFGDRAYETVKYQYNMDTIAIKYAEILKGLR
jgi:SAM-dependent methyltransferase/glycosyltransferase involved in cell wall biosynthesis